MTCFREESNKPHFVLVPLLAAQGHLIPMVDIGCILAERGVRVSLIITPANADRIKPTIKRAKEANLAIEFVELSFPNVKFGLPPGCDSIDSITDRGLYRAFFEAIYSLDEPLEAFLGSLERPPDCMITDMCNGWTGPVARKFGIPRVIFHGPCCFYISTDYNLVHHKVYDSITDENEYVIVPEFPIKLQVTKNQTPGFLNSPLFEDMRKQCLEEELTADGVVINTFLELEQLFVENYEKVIGKKVWTIGPICLYNKDFEMKVGRGNKEAIDQSHRVLTWLNSRDAASVLYISFGSLAYTNPQQLMEIGNALEALNKPFIWAIKKIEMKPEVENWISAGFEERTKDRGLIIVGWAPQMVILSHQAVGGFITHCGWNSLLEAISVGVPMITWPRFADQFVNEKLIVDVLRIGVSLGVKVPNFANEDGVMVKSDDVREAVCALMDGGFEADERRERSNDFSDKAKKAVEEGGSSYMNFTDFIHYFTEHQARSK
ncbi:UDP-glycosyltransferase 73C6-like protein [Carex littledalei]|uniref:Glycosyltransferase n=1 Tax=Carex littledalei TaxID=544730 RepID=A0A833QL03_9POAL|nr:UDP-glycosyltransferase 73C6-like protein [Carex littledalei]